MAQAVLTCDMVSKRSQDSGFSLVYTPNALPGKNSPTANKHMGKCFDRVKLVSLCTSHAHVCHHTVSRILCVISATILPRLFGASGLKLLII